MTDWPASDDALSELAWLQIQTVAELNAQCAHEEEERMAQITVTNEADGA